MGQVITWTHGKWINWATTYKGFGGLKDQKNGKQKFTIFIRKGNNLYVCRLEKYFLDRLPVNVEA